MKKKYDITNVENLIQKVVEAVKNGEEYIENSSRQLGSRFYFEMEDGKVIPEVESAEVIEDSVPQEQFEEELNEGMIDHLANATKREIIYYIGDRAEVDMSMRKDDLLEIAKGFVNDRK